MKILRLSFILVCLSQLAAAVQAGAATWEYATLQKSGVQVGASVSWQSPKGELSGKNVSDLAKKLTSDGEIQPSEADYVIQLLQALGRMGWELVQVETDYPPGEGKIYYFKRQTS